ncbi:MAG: matrixin family metalloprotease [Bacteriovorax sp.]|jgi:hypothetical protein|nr:matrixin family metalloprotease [Bacteriovorax sp.]
MKSFIGITLLALLFTACKQETTETQAASATPSAQGGGCTIGKWSNLQAPMNLKISSDFLADFSNADMVNGLNPFEQMAKAWNDSVSPSTSFFVLPMLQTATTGSTTLSDYRDDEMGIYKSSTWFSGVSSSALAITQFYGVVRSDASLGTYIDLTHADILVNYRDFGSEFSYSLSSLSDYDLPTVLLHEMGHFLGLCHESSRPSIMAPYYYSTLRSLKTYDTAKIRALYLNNQNYALSIAPHVSALSAPIGSEVHGHIELNANGLCNHYVEGKLIYQHPGPVSALLTPHRSKSIPLR